MVARGYLQDCTDLEGLDARLTRRRRARLRRLRRHRAVAARRPPAQHHDAALAAEDRPQADHADGRRHHQGRRPVVPLRRAPAALARARSPPTSPRIRGGLRQVPRLRRRRPTARSCSTTPSGSTSSTTSTFLRDIGRHFSVNRMLVLRERQVAARPRPDAELPRVQLHDPAGLRLPRAPPPRGLPAADGRLRPVGQHRQRHRPDPPRRRRRGLRPDLAAAHHLRRRQDGQVRRRRRSGSTPRCCAPYDFWQFWRNTTDADVGRFLKLYTELPVAECDRLGALGGAEINAAKITLANEVTTLCHGAEAAAAAEATARAVFEQGGVGRGPAEWLTSPPTDLGAGLANAHFLVSTALVRSGKEAKRLIAEKGLRFNNALVLGPERSGHRRDDRRRPQDLGRQEAPRAGPARHEGQGTAADSARQNREERLQLDKPRLDLVEGAACAAAASSRATASKSRLMLSEHVADLVVLEVRPRRELRPRRRDRGAREARAARRHRSDCSAMLPSSRTHELTNALSARARPHQRILFGGPCDAAAEDRPPAIARCRAVFFAHTPPRPGP